MPINKELARKEIPFLVPDLPSCAEVTPYLQAMDRNRWYSNFGPLQHQLEQGLNNAFFPEINCDEERIVTCSSGTSAIELALLSLDLPRNARILLPSFTFAATATAVIRAGYCPVFTDVDPTSWLLTPEIALNVLDYLTVDAVLPVAGLGVSQDVREWDSFTERKGIPVVIDAAAALGEQQVGRTTTVCYSMHATKAFGIGEGGILVTNNQALANKARCLSNFGFEEGMVATAGSNYKLSEYHAAVGLAQLDRLDTLKIRRERVRAAYDRYMEDLLNHFDVQQVRTDRWHAEPGVVSLKQPRFMASVALQLKDPELAMLLPKLIEDLKCDGIGARRWYSPVLHRHPAFQKVETINPRGGKELLVTENLNASLIGLPFHNFLSDSEVAFVCERLLSSIDRFSVDIRASQKI